MRKIAYTALIMLGLVANAQAAAEWAFKITNKSGVAIDRFRTQENGKWSSNWIKEHIEPGDTFNMHFNHVDGDCTVRTQISFEDNTFFDVDVDYCKAEKLNVYDKSVKYE